MKIGLFIPCYINQYYPKVGIATYKLLQQLGFEVEYPTEQTCCGQALGNAGYQRFTVDAQRHFRDTFEEYEVVVSPSASCIMFVREYKEFVQYRKQEIYELSEFIVNKGLLDQLTASFPKKVGILQSCHGLRGLRLGSSTELMETRGYTLTKVLASVKDISIVEADRPDDCCGFGGTFSVKEADLSVKMGMDRIDDLIKNGAEIVTGTDVSCLMHLEGIIKKRKLRLEAKHFSEILMPI
jgi:L-lactate dehydrogenase complex protein LldE